MKLRMVVFDTNVFEQYRDIHRGQWLIFRAISRKLQLTIGIPEVVVQEVSSHIRRQQEKLKSEADNQLRALSDLFAETWDNMQLLNISELHEDLPKRLKPIVFSQATPEEIEQRLQKRMAYMFGRSFSVLPLPKLSVQELLTASLSQRKPFKSSGTGFKDYLIWLSIVNVLQTEKDIEVLFVSSNHSDFGTAGNLERDLLSDLNPNEQSRISNFEHLVQLNSSLAEESLPAAPVAMKLLQSTGRKPFKNAINQYYSKYCHPIHETGVCDDMEGETSFSYSPLILLNLNQVNSLDDQTLFIEANFAWTIDASPSYNPSVIPGTSLKRGYIIKVDMIYDLKNEKISEMAFVDQIQTDPIELHLNIRTETTFKGWRVTARTTNPEHLWERVFTDYDDLLECADDFELHLSSSKESAREIEHAVRMTVPQVLEAWTFIQIDAQSPDS